jgi:hypothetical protein
MLKMMRKHAKYFYFLFLMVIISFVFWGIGRVDKTGGVEIVAEVGKYKITTEKMNLKENVLNSMIDEQVLLIAAKEAGIHINDEELQEAIIHDPAFIRNGVFDKDVYLNRLRLNRITPEAYESSKRQEVTVVKMKHLIELSVDSSVVNSNLEQVSGDNQVAKMLREQMLNDRKEKAVKSYIEGFRKQIKIKINEQLIS